MKPRTTTLYGGKQVYQRGTDGRLTSTTFSNPGYTKTKTYSNGRCTSETTTYNSNGRTVRKIYK